MTTRAKRALAYIRVSKKIQATHGRSIDEQRRDIIRWCETEGYAIRDEDFLIDPGITGRKAHRPGLTRLTELVDTGAYDIVVVWRLDRTARKPGIGYKLRDALDRNNTEIFSITEPYIQNRYMFGNALLQAEAEFEYKSDRSVMAAYGRARAGKIPPGSAKYGYGVNRDGTFDEKTGKFHPGADNGRPIINEAEAAIVRRMFHEYVYEGKGLAEIADGLHADGIFTRFGNEWTPENMAKLIKSPEYTGKGHWMKNHQLIVDNGERDIVKAEPREQEDWIEIDFPQIIDPDTWNKAQDIRKRNYRLRARTGATHYFPLKHLVYCESCGSRFSTRVCPNYSTRTQPDGTKKRVRNGSVIRSYTCTKGRSGRHGCARPNIGAIKLEKAVWGMVVKYIAHPENMRALIESRREELEQTGTLAEVERLRNKLTELEGERQRALTAFQKQYMDEAELDVRMKGINERREMYEAQLKRSSADVENLESQLAMLDDFVTSANQIKERIPNLTEEERGELIRIFVTNVSIGEEIKVELIFGSGIVNDSPPQRRQSVVDNVIGVTEYALI